MLFIISTLIQANIDTRQQFLFPFLERKKFRVGNSNFVTLDDTDDSDIDHSDVEDSDV